MIGARDEGELAAGISAWAEATAPDKGPAVVTNLGRPASGWSNETLLVELARSEGSERMVIRLPTRVPSFPVYDLHAQFSVQSALSAAGVPVARPLLVEDDPRWLGAPFLVMDLVDGRAAGEVPSLDQRLMGEPENAERELHQRFVRCLAEIHLLDWRAAGLGGSVRGAGGDLARELTWWRDYIAWSTAGDPPAGLAQLGGWCAAALPPGSAEVPLALCWGDARLGNVLFDDDWRVTAMLDWELASIGPPEMDLAWYLALDDLSTSLVSLSVPGFLPRPEVVALYESCLGRPVVHLGWHETFALLRAAAIYDRQARMAAELGDRYTGAAGIDNPPLSAALERIESASPDD